MMTTDYDLAIVAANAAGQSLARDAFAAGVESIVLIDEGRPQLADLGGKPDTRFGVVTSALSVTDGVTVSGNGFSLTAQVAVVAGHPAAASMPPDYPIPSSLSSRIHFSLPDDLPAGDDVLIVGIGETAAQHCEDLVERGQNEVVLSLPSTSFNNLSALTRERLLKMEAERAATVFWHARPTDIEDVEGLPMALFADRRSPDLQFDHIVYALDTPEPARRLERLGITLQAAEDVAPSVYVLGDQEFSADIDTGFVYVAPGRAWPAIRAAHFPDLAEPSDLTARPTLLRQGLVEQLRAKHYNATITEFANAHSDLWILRVRPDSGDPSHQAGQYATLALGYWEPRLDGLDEELDMDQMEKLVRRSYSISHPILDPDGSLAPALSDDIEFYIVLVRPEGLPHLPELTPRLALKRPGDRIFMGGKVAGRYTLRYVTDPDADIIFCATGTGEAPHNNMLNELLRRGHRGRIVAACTVRYQRDLAYLQTHREIEERYPNYRYLPLTTREPETINNKIYIQDLITNGMLAEVLGHEPDPESAHFYLCGNPAMIGIPEWSDGTPTFPETRGVCQILYERGFTIDHRGVEGNVHYEEYW